MKIKLIYIDKIIMLLLILPIKIIHSTTGFQKRANKGSITVNPRNEDFELSKSNLSSETSNDSLMYTASFNKENLTKCDQNIMVCRDDPSRVKILKELESKNQIVITKHVNINFRDRINDVNKLYSAIDDLGSSNSKGSEEMHEGINNIRSIGISNHENKINTSLNEHHLQERINQNNTKKISKWQRVSVKSRSHQRALSQTNMKPATQAANKSEEERKRSIDRIRRNLNDNFYTNNAAEVAEDEIEFTSPDKTQEQLVKYKNHKSDRSLFDNHNYNNENPNYNSIHSINQLYSSLQSQDLSDYPSNIGSSGMPRNRNIAQNPMTPYFESSSPLPTFTTARSFDDTVRKYPSNYYFLKTTTTTPTPEYDYFEEIVEEAPFESQKRWSQPANGYNFRPMSKLSSGYGGNYGYSGPGEYVHSSGYGHSGPSSYHSGPPTYYGHSGHGHHHVPIITETIIHKPAPKYDFKKLAILTLFKFGISKLKWFFILKLLLLKLLKLKFVLFLLFLKLYLFFKFLKFLKFLKLILLPLLLLLPLIPLLLLASLLLFLPVPVLAPATGTTSTFFGTGKKKRKRRDIVASSSGKSERGLPMNTMVDIDSEQYLELLQRVLQARDKFPP